jgi:PPOX class probable F420-dependent enzyme
MSLAAHEVTIAAPADVVWAHLTTAEGLVRWVGPHATADPVPGGVLRWARDVAATLRQQSDATMPRTTRPPHIANLEAASTALLTTFRRSGEGVSTPVSITVDGDDVYFVTTVDSGKAKRLARNDAVTIAPCMTRTAPERIVRTPPAAPGPRRAWRAVRGGHSAHGHLGCDQGTTRRAQLRRPADSGQ